ncbi:Diacylglycerol kinase [Anaerobiospirillum thomasii]|uniref:Diacylglycerol kinase n=1 Tax=Anaerobiospirillum thomasii TaxID=179995 RepID=A0A2X0WNI1_9GAMM|nr:diacylglycerol kinase [Anaerobiospirillum thomasii]SPT68102.1 Diacylglycerol kinase [Anaerobiospirillum thomasii]SPT70562.1 Diacylglycerol kinase [Anaerobiospirillum thomasii]
MAKTSRAGIARIYHAFFYSMKGFKAAFKYEAAARQEFMLAVILSIIAFFIATSLAELMLLLILPWLTFTFEIINSAIEAVVDRISDDYHELSGRAKDLGSAAVFVFLVLTPLCYVAVFGKYMGWWFN